MAHESPLPGVDLAHGSRMTSEAPGLSHRSDGIFFRYLFEGDDDNDDDRANNYIISLVTQRDFQSPLHHHNFDQFRFAWHGDFNLGPGITLKEGQLAYTSEGVFYGPQLDDDSERTCLVFQFAGASGQGFTSQRKLQDTNKQLQQLGTFHAGQYVAHDGSPPLDGYQALWEHANAPRKLLYPAPRYAQTVIMDPTNYAWRADPRLDIGGDTDDADDDGDDGNSTSGSKVDGSRGRVFSRLLGCFTEREVCARQLRLEAGAGVRIGVRDDDAIQLLVVTAGEGAVAGARVERGSAVRLGRRVGVEIGAVGELQLLHFILPRAEA